MGSVFGGGGGGGSPPTAPELKQVDTSLTGPLYTRSAAIGDQWANLMRGSYGLQPATPEAPASWEAKFLGPGALAMMGQAARPFAGQQDPQVQGTLTKAMGAPSYQGTAGRGGSTWNLGTNPYQMSKTLGQPPLQQLQRNQGFETSLLKQWQPPDLRLTGEDLLKVKMGQAAENAKAQQAAFEAALQGSSYASQAQAQAQAAQLSAFGKVGSSAINALSPSLFSSGYYTPSIGPAFSGVTYGAGSDVSNALGPALESGAPAGGSSYGS